MENSAACSFVLCKLIKKKIRWIPLWVTLCLLGLIAGEVMVIWTMGWLSVRLDGIITAIASLSVLLVGGYGIFGVFIWVVGILERPYYYLFPKRERFESIPDCPIL